MRKIKTLEINIDLCTDGDFGPKENMGFDYDGYEGYTTSREFTTNKNGYEAVFQARDWLDELAVSWSIAPHHAWLVKDLYDIVNGMREFLFDNASTETYYRKTMYGNYNGTEFEVSITELEEPIVIDDWPATIKSTYRRAVEDECGSDGEVTFKLWWGWDFNAQREKCITRIEGIRELHIDDDEMRHNIGMYPRVSIIGVADVLDTSMATIMTAKPEDLRIRVTYINPVTEKEEHLATYQVTGFYECDYVNNTVTAYAKEVEEA